MAPYPDDHFKLGRYLEQSINIGHAMMAKIIKGNNRYFIGTCTKH